jgi:hypothetical protein
MADEVIKFKTGRTDVSGFFNGVGDLSPFFPEKIDQ